MHEKKIHWHVCVCVTKYTDIYKYVCVCTTVYWLHYFILSSLYYIYTRNAISKEIKSNCFLSLSLSLSYMIIILYIRWSLTVHFNIIQIPTTTDFTANVACNNSPPTTDFVCSTADILNMSSQTHNFVKHSERGSLQLCYGIILPQLQSRIESNLKFNNVYFFFRNSFVTPVVARRVEQH